MKNINDELYQLMTGKKSGVAVTVVQKNGSGPSVPGAKMIVYADGSSNGSVGGGSVEKLAIDEAIKILKSGGTLLKKYEFTDSDNDAATGMICGGEATLFFEYYVAPAHIYIFGGGHIGRALAYHLHPLNYHVTVIDNRPEALEMIQGADKTVHGEFDTVLSEDSIPPHSYFIIATYDHQFDGLVLQRIFASNWQPDYVGMVASRRKRSILLEELKAAVPGADISKCFIPVGLDIGGSTPDEIAIAILAEIQAIHYQKNGDHLSK